MSLLDELNPTCPRGCGRTMDDCHEAEDGGECEGGELLRENERLTAELGIAEDLVAAGITKRDKLRAELKKLRAELAEAKRELAILADFLHARSEHPAYEYATTTGPRKAFDNYDLPPDGEGWEPNVHSGNDDAWSRLEYHEERYWRRLWVDKDHETGAPVWADWHVPSQAVVSEAAAHAADKAVLEAAEALADIERDRSAATEDSSIWLESQKKRAVDLIWAVDSRRLLMSQSSGSLGQSTSQPVPTISQPLEQPTQDPADEWMPDPLSRLVDELWRDFSGTTTEFLSAMETAYNLGKVSGNMTWQQRAVLEAATGLCNHVKEYAPALLGTGLHPVRHLITAVDALIAAESTADGGGQVLDEAALQREQLARIDREIAMAPLDDESTADGPEQTDERPSKFEIRATTDKGGPCETCGQPRNRHVCLSCSPTGDEPGSGCINCRQTGWDQTPCLPPHRWTRHGWRCCQAASEDRPRWIAAIAKCGGPEVCVVCKTETAEMAGHRAASVSAQAEAGKGVDPNDCPGCHGDAGQVARHVPGCSNLPAGVA